LQADNSQKPTSQFDERSDAWRADEQIFVAVGTGIKALHLVAYKLGVSYQSVFSQCTVNSFR